MQGGYAALTMTLVVIFASLAVIGGLTFFSLQEVGVNRAYTTSVAAHYIAEGGTEDALYRVLAGKQIASTQNLGVGTGTTTISVTTNPDGSKILRSQGTTGAVQQNIETMVGITTNAINFFYGVQVDAGGVAMHNGASVIGNIFSNGSLTGGTVTGTAVVAGGTNNQIANTTVGTSARAPQFVNANVGGSSCPNVNCVVASDPLQPLPISDGAIQDFRDAAAAGGTVADQNISGTVSLGPKKINGNLTVDNGATLIVTGTLWITGQFQPSNNATIKLSPGYGTNSGVIVADNTIDLSNNVTVLGSGSVGGYILMVAGKNAPSSQIIDISNNVVGAIFYAPHGRIHFNNNAGAKEVAGYGFDMDNNATVTYESGLQNVHFVSGPSGGYDVKYWKEVQ